MTGRLAGKVAVVTGASRGIGAATARRMSEEGASVVVSDIDGDRGRALVDELSAAGGQAVFCRADVSDAADAEALVATALDAFGRLDVLHNNAGVHETAFTDRAGAIELDEAVWDKVIAINLKGTWLCSKYAAPALAQAGGGAIVNSASVGGLAAYPMGSAYGPSKAAVIHLTKVLALELAPQGTRVNCYAPGNTDTDMVRQFYEGGTPEQQAAVRSQLVGTHLLPRLGCPEEVANVVVFLASEEASMMTGACVVVDLGTMAWRGVQPDA